MNAYAPICRPLLCVLTVDGVSTVLGHVADKAAPHMKKHGSKMVPESLKKGKDGQPSNMDGVKLVAASSLQGCCFFYLLFHRCGVNLRSTLLRLQFSVVFFFSFIY